MAENIDTIAAILNKAENAATDAERDTFMRAAEVKAARINLDLDAARAHTEEKNSRDSRPVSERVDVGKKGQPSRRRLAELFNEIALAYDLKTVLNTNGHYIHLVGMKHDVEMVKLLYSSLSYQMMESAFEFLDEGEWRSEGVTKHQARDSFYAGFTNKVGQRIRANRREVIREQEESEQDGSTAIVLRDKRNEVNAAYYDEFGYLKSYRAKGAASRHSRNVGVREGEKARIGSSRPVTDGREKQVSR